MTLRTLAAVGIEASYKKARVGEVVLAERGAD
jgi:hypothetical protein